MVTNEQVRNLMKLIQKEKTLSIAAAKAGMDEKTARKYRRSGKLPTQMAKPHIWRTRNDPFAQVWPWVTEKLKDNPGLEAKTLFEALQREYPGRFPDGQLRTLQRHIKAWRALEGPSREIFFTQVYRPGEWSGSDFTCMNKLGITIAGQPFNHMIYHFVLPYSNWETGTICYSESFESLSQGIQDAFWKLGGVTKYHRTDSLSAAVKNLSNPKEFTQRYNALANHYGFHAVKTQPARPNENGDVEQRHHRLKRALEQSLMLRGSRDFADIQEYQQFLNKMFDQLNTNRQKRFQEELSVLRQLPLRRLEDFQELNVKVSQGSIIRVRHNTYSVHSRLIGEKVKVRVYADHLEVWYGQRKVDHFPRLRGENKARIDYRHIIDCLIKKPGAFSNYRYRRCLFPSSQFRMAYDWLNGNMSPNKAVREYLEILQLAARETELGVNDALRSLINQGLPLTVDLIKKMLEPDHQIISATEIQVDQVDLSDYDELFEQGKEVCTDGPE